MAKYLDILELTQSVLKMVEEKEQVKLASFPLENAYKTEIGRTLSEAVEMLKSATEPSLTYADLNSSNTPNTPVTSGYTFNPTGNEVSDSLRKIANTLREKEALFEATKHAQAAQIKRAAIGIEHLIRRLS